MNLYDVLVLVGMKDGLVGFTYEVWTFAAESAKDVETQAKVKAEFMSDESLILEWRVSKVGEAGEFDKLIEEVEG